MSLILTFLGKGGVGRTTIAIAAAKALSAQGKRVLLAHQQAGPGLSLLLGQPVSAQIQEISPNFKAIQLQGTVLLEQSWEEVKKLEAQYLRTPFFKEVYGQELGILPGMDSALALNALREYDATGQYDVILYDGPGDNVSLRMLGTPEILSWYIRRFRKLFTDSDFGRNLMPVIQLASTTVLNVNWPGDGIDKQTNQVNNMLENGRQAVSDPSRMAAYLVTSTDAASIATAQYLWGSAQQIGLTVGGTLLNRSEDSGSLGDAFNPLTAYALPNIEPGNWQPLVDALPDLTQTASAPKPVTINLAQKTVSLFLPGFDKKQVKLTQSGPEVTIDAGDQRRNLFLPPELSGRKATGAKFHEGHLIVSFG
ncbi:ArsA family ATPase [Leptolyngbya sp. FACHB-261]|uniref:Get3/ArsA fold putative tail anchor-mediating ATPase NosAFP n=1 Tax=Leptolyngbya sp. FACHB-261 TaxID=2692806 RepID=UPI00168A20B8|nr:ArsA family ATPase [Leptolyngbya sp. FACHB-261]MBD2102721.1 ArsA family ATPase [Leptolyngbya sp. FACHB-261]